MSRRGWNCRGLRCSYNVWWGVTVERRATQTVTVAPGVFADMDSQGRLIGIEVLDASGMLGEPLKVEVALPTGAVKQGVKRDA